MLTSHLTRSETDPSATSVHLIGSWDNFTARYAMTRDSRRGRGVWRGCPSAKDLVVSETGRGLKRNAALQMGHDYYYYVS